MVFVVASFVPFVYASAASGQTAEDAAQESLAKSQQSLIKQIKSAIIDKGCTADNSDFSPLQSFCAAVGTIDLDLLNDRPPEDLYRTAEIVVTLLDKIEKEPSQLRRFIKALDSNDADAVRSLLQEVDDISVIPSSFCKSTGIDAKYCRNPECLLPTSGTTPKGCSGSAPTIDLTKARAWYHENHEYLSNEGDKLALPRNRHVLSAIAFLSEVGPTMLKALPSPTTPTFLETTRIQIRREMACRAYRDFRLSLLAITGNTAPSNVIQSSTDPATVFEAWKKSESTLCISSEKAEDYQAQLYLPALEALAKLAAPVAQTETPKTASDQPWKATYDFLAATNVAHQRVAGVRIHLNAPLKVIPTETDERARERLTVSGALSLLLPKDGSPFLGCTDFCQVDLGITVAGLGLQRDEKTLGVFSAADKISVQVDSQVLTSAIARIAAIPPIAIDSNTDIFSVSNLQLGSSLLPFSFDLSIRLPGVQASIPIGQVKIDTTTEDIGLFLLTDTEKLRKAISAGVGSSLTLSIPANPPLSLRGALLDPSEWSAGRYCYSSTVDLTALGIALGGTGSNPPLVKAKACASSEKILSLEPIELSSEQLATIQAELGAGLAPVLNKLASTSELGALIKKATLAELETLDFSGSKRLVIHLSIGEPLVTGSPFPLDVDLSSGGPHLSPKEVELLAQRILEDQSTSLAWSVGTQLSGAAQDMINSAFAAAHFPPDHVTITCRPAGANHKACDVRFNGTSISIVNVQLAANGTDVQLNFADSRVQGLVIQPVQTEWLSMEPAAPVLAMRNGTPSIQVSGTAKIKGLERTFVVSGTINISDPQLSFDDKQLQEQLRQAVLAQLPVEANKALAGLVVDTGVAKLEGCKLTLDNSQLTLEGQFTIAAMIPVAVRIPVLPAGSVTFTPDPTRIQEFVHGRFSLPGIGQISLGKIPAQPTSWSEFFIPFTIKLTFLDQELSLNAVLRASGDVVLDDPVSIPLLVPTISVGTFSLDQPSLDIYLRRAGEFSLKGKLVFATQTSLIANLDSTFTAHLGDLKFDVDGFLNVAGVGLARVDGTLDLANAKLSGIAKTIGPLAAVMPAQDSINADGQSCTFEQVTSIQLLGARADESLLVQVLGTFGPKHCGQQANAGVRVSARGNVQLGPLGNAEGGVDVAVPSFALAVFATAHTQVILPVTVGVKVNQSFVHADLDATLVRATINLKSTQSLTTGLIDEIIKSLLNPSINFQALLDAIKNHRISISLSGGSGNGGGDGSSDSNDGDDGGAGGGGSAGGGGGAGQAAKNGGGSSSPEQGIVPGSPGPSNAQNEQPGWPGQCSFRFEGAQRLKSCDNGPFAPDAMLTPARVSCLKSGRFYPTDFYTSGLAWSAVIGGGTVLFVPISDRTDLGNDCFPLSLMITQTGIDALFSTNSGGYLNSLASSGGQLTYAQVAALQKALDWFMEKHSPVDVSCLDPQACTLLRIAPSNSQPDASWWIVGRRYLNLRVDPGSLLSAFDKTPLPPSLVNILKGDYYVTVLDQTDAHFLMKLVPASGLRTAPKPTNLAILDMKSNDDARVVAEIKPPENTPRFNAQCFRRQVGLGQKPIADVFASALHGALSSISSTEKVHVDLVCENNYRKAVYLSGDGGQRSITLVTAVNNDSVCVRSAREDELRTVAQTWRQPPLSDFPPEPEWMGSDMMERLEKVLTSTQKEWRDAKFGRNPAFLLNIKSGACQ